MSAVKQWLKQNTPWWARIGAKMALARLPAGYAFWQRMGLFRHGDMDQSGYALSVFEAHVQRAGLSMESLTGKVILEMGPDDSVATAIIAHALGARAILIDAGRYASASSATYEPLCRALAELGGVPVDTRALKTLDELLQACGARYLVTGAAAWSEIASQSVDLVFSQAVLEHVRLHEFEQVQRECKRVLKPRGAASHRVDLKDHLGGALNNLRLPRGWWESDFFVNSGFYTNRIRMSYMLGMFEDAGFRVQCEHVERWHELPTPRKSLAAEFAHLADDELRVSGFDVLLFPQEDSDQRQEKRC